MATDPADPDMDAGELALGLLDGPERATALRRVLAEPPFAREVERWREHFGGLFEAWPEAAAPAEGWARIERAIAPVAERSGGGWAWKAATVGSSLVAASLIAVLLVRQPTPAPLPAPVKVAAPAQPLVATLIPTGDAKPIAALYDAATGEVRLPASAYAPGGKSAELWLIDSKGTPRAIGLLAVAGGSRVTVPHDLRREIASGLTLAVSVEPIGGSPTGKPTGPVVAAGTLFAA